MEVLCSRHVYKQSWWKVLFNLLLLCIALMLNDCLQISTILGREMLLNLQQLRIESMCQICLLFRHIDGNACSALPLLLVSAASGSSNTFTAVPLYIRYLLINSKQTCGSINSILNSCRINSTLHGQLFQKHTWSKSNSTFHWR